MFKRDTIMALTDGRDAPVAQMRQLKAARIAAGFRLEEGQRFHRVGLTLVVWCVLRVYHDSQGLEHAILTSNRPDLDPKTLSAAVLLDSRQYRLV